MWAMETGFEDYFWGLRVMWQRLPHRVGVPLHVEVKEVSEFSVMLEWESPQDNSNSKGTHYTVQKVMGKLHPLPPKYLPSEPPNDA